MTVLYLIIIKDYRWTVSQDLCPLLLSLMNPAPPCPVTTSDNYRWAFFCVSCSLEYLVAFSSEKGAQGSKKVGI